MIKLYAYKQYVTDKESFGYDEQGARIGETPNIALDCGTPELANVVAASPDLLNACRFMLITHPQGLVHPDEPDSYESGLNELIKAIRKAEGVKS